MLYISLPNIPELLLMFLLVFTRRSVIYIGKPVCYRVRHGRTRLYSHAIHACFATRLYFYKAVGDDSRIYDRSQT